MDFDTALLIALTASALGWFFWIRINEERKNIRKYQEQEIADLQRAERVKGLNGRL